MSDIATVYHAWYSVIHAMLMEAFEVHRAALPESSATFRSAMHCFFRAMAAKFLPVSPSKGEKRMLFKAETTLRAFLLLLTSQDAEAH